MTTAPGFTHICQGYRLLHIRQLIRGRTTSGHAHVCQVSYLDVCVSGEVGLSPL